MAGPITWQNVNGPALGDAGRTMGAATQTFQDLFAGLRGTLKDANTELKDSNTQAMRQALYSAQTPEALAALQGPNGKLAQMMTQNQGFYDPSVDAMADGRGDVLRQQATNALTFKKTQDEATSAPLLEMGKRIALNGTPEQLQAWNAANPQILGGANVMDFAHTVQQRAVAEKQSAERFTFDQAAEARKVLMAPLERQKVESGILTDAAQRTASLQNAITGKLHAEIAQDSLTDARTQRAALLKDASIKAGLVGTMYQNGAASGQDIPAFQAAIKDNKSLNDSEKQKMLGKVQELMTSGIDIPYVKNGKEYTQNVPLPRDKVVEILGSAYDSTVFSKWNNGGAAHFEQRIKDSLLKMDKATVNGESKDFSPAINDYLAMMEARKQQAANPVLLGATNRPKPGSQGRAHKPY
jgi:hypothetical protein